MNGLATVGPAGSCVQPIPASVTRIIPGCFCLFASLLGALGAARASQPDRPVHAQRVVQAFEFEERELHDAPVPLNWYRAQHNPPDRHRPGFPIWNRATIEYESAMSGSGCVRLPTKGGSTSLRLRTGVIPVLPGADYTIQAMVRAENLRYAHPAINVVLVDERGEPIESTRRRELLSLGDERWRAIEVLLDEAPPRAAFLQIDLELLQPSAIGNDAETGFFEDIDGAAWFDVVVVMMRPRVSLASGPPAGVSNDRMDPELVFSARDLAGDRLDATISVYDIDGRIVDARRFLVDPSGRATRWSPALSEFGWYRAVAQIRAGDALVGRATHDLLHLPGEDPSRSRIGMLLGEFDPNDPAARLQLAEAMGLGEVMMPAWRDSADPSGIESHVEQLAAMVDRLRRQRVGVVLMLDRVPAWAARQDLLDRNQVAAFLASQSPALSALLDPILERLGQAVTRWAIGDTAEPWDPTIRDEIAEGERALARLVPGPRVVSAAPARDMLLARDGLGLDRSVLLARIDGSLAEQVFNDVAGSLEDLEGRADLWLLMRPLDPQQFGVRASIRGLARQLIAAHAHLGDQTGVVLLDVESETVAGPPPALAAMAAVADRIAGRRVVGEFPVGAGVRCFILEGDSPDEPGALVAWHDGSLPTPPVLDAMLALDDVTVVDLFGNRRDVALSAADERGIRTHRVEISAMPIFIEGIDTPLVRFQSEFTITPDRLATDNSHHEHQLVFTNPWTAPIAGQFFLVEPGGVRDDGTRDRAWDISPRTGVLDWLPGEVSEVTVRIAMSPYQPAGTLIAVVDVELQAGRDYGVVRLRRPLSIDIDDLAYRVSHEVRGDHLFVDISLASGADEDRDLEILAFAGADSVRQRSVVSDLEPGGFASRRLVFDRTLAGERVFVSVLDSKSGSRLNTIIDIGAALAAAPDP